MSRRESFKMPCATAKRAMSAFAIPTVGTPATTPTVAGWACWSRTSPSIARARSRLCGYGNPCEITVLSSATTGSLPASAARICSGIWMVAFTVFSDVVDAAHRF
jgi:hypothetical protein